MKKQIVKIIALCYDCPNYQCGLRFDWNSGETYNSLCSKLERDVDPDSIDKDCPLDDYKENAP